LRIATPWIPVGRFPRARSRVHDTIACLQNFGVRIHGCDPLLTAETVWKYFGIHNVEFARVCKCDCVLVANKHSAFRSITLGRLKAKMKPTALIDTKNLFDPKAAQGHRPSTSRAAERN
jgi:UDP-N-acetyl-D-mannosaminuronate dehydrogenase